MEVTIPADESFSEYVLYEPILRILTARGCTVKFEVECPAINQPTRGDKKRLDLVAEKGAAKFAMEVKWKKETAFNVVNDTAKVDAFLDANPEGRAFLCVFWRCSHIEPLRLERLRERGEAVFADFGRTKYGCRVFEMLQGA